MDDTTGNINQASGFTTKQTLTPGGRLNRWIASILDNFVLGLAILPLIIISQIVIQGKISFEEDVIDQILEVPVVVILGLLIVGLYKIGFLVKNVPCE